MFWSYYKYVSEYLKTVLFHLDFGYLQNYTWTQMLCYLRSGSNNAANYTQRGMRPAVKVTATDAESHYCTSPCWTWGNAGLQGFFASGSTDGCCHHLRHSPAPPVENGVKLGQLEHAEYPCICKDARQSLINKKGGEENKDRTGQTSLIRNWSWMTAAPLSCWQ